MAFQEMVENVSLHGNMYEIVVECYVMRMVRVMRCDGMRSLRPTFVSLH